MRKLFLAFSLLLASTCAVRAGDESVLLWMVTDPLDNQSGLSIEQLRYVRDMADGEKYAIARIAVFDGDGNRVVGADGDAYLYVWGEDQKRDNVGVLLPSNEGSWTSENPTYADVSAYSGVDPSYSFMIEIGIYQEDTDLWMILAHSQSATYDELYRAGYIYDGNLEAPEHTPWSGGVYSIPEPSSGLLILIGAGLLALRRRRHAA